MSDTAYIIPQSDGATTWRTFHRSCWPRQVISTMMDCSPDAQPILRAKRSRIVTQPSWSTHAPKKILLATDLSSRCDRALDRAAHLAKLWNAQLLVLHVLEPARDMLESERIRDLPSWRRSPDRVRVARQQIERDLLHDHPTVEVRVAEGEPAATIDAIARTEACDLIVTGVARDETFGRYLLGATVDRLVRRTPVPILIVKRRLKPYGEIVVATDFSEPSRHALNAAARFFPRCPLTLFHAFEIPFAGFLDKVGFREQFESVEKEASQRFLDGSDLPEELRRGVKVLVEYGPPDAMIQSYIQDRNVGLTALGTHGRSAVFDILIGSTAKRILDAAPSDVLLIRDPRAAGAN
jgi:nucleotide-binding universal stress UspA family protein